MLSWQGFTLRAVGGLLRDLRTACHISPSFDPSSTPVDQHPASCEFVAIWDTGATNSVITQQVIDACGLVATGMAQSQSAHGTKVVETFLVNIGLINEVQILSVPVTKAELGPDTQVLIGMDIITLGDFVVTNKDGITVFSFRTPSQVCVDFVEQHRAEQLQESFKHGGSTKHRKERHKTYGKNKK